MSILKRLAFRILFPNYVKVKKQNPVPDVNVFVLAERQHTRFVHIAKYDPEYESYDSEDGWFEKWEVTYWCYVKPSDVALQQITERKV